MVTSLSVSHVRSPGEISQHDFLHASVLNFKLRRVMIRI